jgi:hypothetical protein
MKSIVIFTFASISLAGCTTAISTIPQPSQQWLPIGETKEGNIISIDTANLSTRKEPYKAIKYESAINNEQNIVKKDEHTLWVRVDYKKTQPSAQSATQFYASFNCNKGTFQTLQHVQLGGMGEKLAVKPINMPPSRISPASTEDIVLKQVCWSNTAQGRDRS